MDVIELPFKAEYARSGRASCKFCKSNIAQETLRIAAMVQSAFRDAKQPNWYHADCFFKKQRPSSVGDIDNFSNLRYEDQQTIEKSVAELGSCEVASGSGKGKKRTKTANAAAKDYGIEYAKSGRANCAGCQLKISKDDVRIKKTVYDTEVGMKFGGQALWHHVECFAQVRADLGWLLSGDLLPGYETLKDDDQKIVKKAIPAMKDENLPEAKKAKLEPMTKEEKQADKKLSETLKKQTQLLYQFRDNVKAMRKQDIQELLERNKQDPMKNDTEKLFDQAADLLAFGALKPCPECKGTQLLFNKSGYLCNGQLTEWVKCAKLITDPDRKACKVPSALKSKYSFLNSVKDNPEKRAFRYIPPSVSTITKNLSLKKHDEDEVDGPKVKREKPALYCFQFAHIGMKDEEADLKKRIAKLGGKIDTKINEKVIAIFSTIDEIKKMSSRMDRARELGIHIVPLDYLDSVESDANGAVNFISSMSLCDWGTDPSAKVPKEETKSLKSKSIYTKSAPKSLTLKLKDGLAVDPESGLEDVAHVYVKGKDKYNVVLGLTDIQANKNSYYKLQLLEADNKNKFWIFRAWGRIGTTIGDNKLQKFNSLNSAIENFREVYGEKTGNDFSMREHFKKVPGRMYPIDIDYSEDKTVDLATESNIKSKLHTEVQDLIKLMFDVNSMKRTMLEFDLDMEKMPLGKLSQKQIQSAYSVLTEVYTLIQEGAANARFIDATNRFYTLIPHDFGIRTPPLLDTTEQIEKLRQMLDSLMEIECAYNMLKTEDDTEDEVNPLDKHYAQLKTKLEPLDKSSDEFSTLSNYVQNTHADTHKSYELEIVNIFKVARQGEARRYKPFKKLHNRKLLWHGSRLTNFAGILSHGLKIAPPEAPVTGYMFGKGIYFADMVSKSANYCFTSSQNSTGLLLLSEVALGDMYECKAAKYITELPKGKHSCFGHGATMPNPKESIMREDGVEIPLGKPYTEAGLKSSLLYNEYIVYDIAQVNIQYMFQMNFKYKY